MDENYVISQAIKAFQNNEFAAAKSWILTGKTLYPNNFNVQFEAYKIERAANNFEEAAKCFSYIILTFQNQSIELWNEVSALTAALRVPEGEMTPEQEFYVKMFQHFTDDVQHKILLLTASHSDNNVEHCKLVLLLLKRFPQAIATHSPRLLETMVQGMAVAPQTFQEMLVQEALPLIYTKVPELPSHLVYGIYTICLEYYINRIFEENQDNRPAINEIWRQIFEVLGFCGKVLNWEPFLPFNKSWNKDIYWQKLMQMVTTNPRAVDNNQTLFYATTLFLFSLQEYIANIKTKIDDTEIEYVLVEGFREPIHEGTSQMARENPSEPPKISVTYNCSAETPISFVTAANCWQLLNSKEQLQINFSQLLIKLPLATWISRFLFDLAVYFGHHEEAKKLLNEMQCTSIHHNLRVLSLILIQGPLSIHGFDFILKILSDLPATGGEFIDNLSIVSNQRHLILLPLTQRTIVQYCAKAIVNSLKRRVYEPNCSDLILGDLLVLLQLEVPFDTELAEHIFSMIKEKGQFSYLLFPAYIIQIEFLEEFMHLWNKKNGEFNFEFVSSQTNVPGTRRIGTRGADKGVREDFKQIMMQQVARSNEDLCTLVAHFIAQEHLHLIQNIV